MDMKITRRTKLLIVALVLCMTTMVGSTLAWFTDEVTSANNIIESGNLDIELYVSDNGTDWTEVKDDSAPIFNYSKWEPGYTTYKFFQIKNAGNLALKFQLNLKADSAITGEYKLADVIDVYTGTTVPTRANLGTKVGTLSELMDDVDGAAYGMLNAGDVTTLCIALKMQESAGNEYQGLSVGNGFSLQLLATQAMVETDSFGNDYDAAAGYGVDNWNGEVENNLPNVEENGEEYILITTAEELAGLAANVNAGNSYAGKTIKLGSNIDLGNRAWTPIGNWDNAFEGTFDGQDYTISNLYINLPEEATGSGVGLFGVAQNATIKNINLRDVNVTGYEMVAAVIGSPYEGCTISDCHVNGNINIVAEYAYAGGIAAYGYTSYDNCSVIATGTGNITAKERNAVGGITAWMLEGNNKITNCTVKNLNLTGWSNIGAITGFVHYSNVIDNCTAENINLTKTRIGGNPGIGLVAGGYSYNANSAITITNNTLKNITLSGYSKAYDVANTLIHGSEYGGSTGTNFVLDNNTQTSITDNRLTIAVSIGTADELFAFANDVNVNRNSYAGKLVVLTADIDLENAAWTPIGQTGATQFQGIFDGQGYTIKNLYVDSSTQTGANYSSGLFGWLNKAIVKNVTIENATVTGNHNVAAIAGYLETSGCTVSNCHVVNATVVGKHANNDACGDKVGVIVGHAGNAGVKVENCTVKNSTVTAGRDAGQIAGAAKAANVIDCSATNVTVTAGGDCNEEANIRNEVIGRLL